MGFIGAGNNPEVSEREIHTYHEVMFYMDDDTLLLTESGQQQIKTNTLLIISKETYHFFRLAENKSFLRMKISLSDSYVMSTPLKILFSGLKIIEYPIEHIRYLGVFPRLGIVSAMAALLLMAFKPKNTPWVILTLLAGYCILISVTNSFELNEENILSIVDLAVLGDGHMYHMGGIPFDPEGLLSTIPCIAHCLVGACVGMLLYNKDGICGKYIKGEEPDNWVKVNRVFIFSAISLMAGFLLDYAYPINKAMWSASYVLVTCGLAGLLLALLIWIIDIKGNKKWCVFFESFGVNPLFIFCLSAIFVYIMGVIKFDVAGKTYNVWSAWYRLCMQPLLGDNLGSLACALSLVFVLWLIAHPLYKKRIYIKI
jgi:predicted acyltransferase